VKKLNKLFWRFLNFISCWMQNLAWKKLDKIRKEERHG